MSGEKHTFGDSALTACVSAAGAELVSLKTTGGHDLLWNAGPEWSRHSPVLFPIVGSLPDDTAVIDGKSYRLSRHGFARDRVFRFTETSVDGCVLELHEDEASLAVFPFRFRLWLEYRITGGTLTVRYTLRNPDHEKILHASIGVHPAFCWPLHKNDDRTSYRLEFEEAEPEPIRRLTGALMDPAPYPTPVHGRTLPLSDSLFEADAIVFDRIRSRSLIFGKPGKPALHFTWSGFPQFGVWTKPGAPFLCLEPWHGFSSPAGAEGEFRDKPGLLHLQPREEWEGQWSVRMTDS